MSDKIFDILRMCSEVILPALGVFYAALAKIWLLPLSTQIVGTLVAVETLIGALVVLQRKNYKDGE